MRKVVLCLLALSGLALSGGAPARVLSGDAPAREDAPAQEETREEAPSERARGARSRSSAASCGTSEVRDAIGSILDGGEIRLVSGRIAKLAGVRLGDGEEAAAARAWLARHLDEPARVVSVRREDRWGRAGVRIAPADARSGPDLAQGLVEEGLAIVDVGEAETLCQPELLALEATARERGLGLWAKDRYKPVRPSDGERLRQAVGRFALVEGSIGSVGERRQRTYLNVETGDAERFTVTIPKRTWAIMVDKGLSAQGLKGRRVRVRGVLEAWRGFSVEVTAADMIEILDRERRRR